MSFGIFIVATVLTLASSREKFYIGRYTKNNACIGGSIQVISVPDNLIVNRSNCNVKYKKEDFEVEPIVKYPEAWKKDKYTLIMLDPSAPGLEEDQYYLHWIVANIKGCDLQFGNFRDANEISSYLAPDPPSGSGFHRYQFIIYLQVDYPTKNGVPLLTYPDHKRNRFNLERWVKAQERSTTFIGPITGTQFLAEYGYDY